MTNSKSRIEIISYGLQVATELGNLGKVSTRLDYPTPSLTDGVFELRRWA